MTRSGAAVRLVDVAQAAGVSLATASRALAGRYGVSPETIAHVREVALQVGYQPNAHARALAGGAADIVGLVVHDVSDPYFAEIARGVVQAAESRGLMALISQSSRDPAEEVARIRRLRANQVEAIVLAGSGYVDPAVESHTADELRSFAATGGRAVVIGRHHLAVDAVLPDNVGAGTAVTRHLLDLGHTRIGIVSGPPALTTVTDRMRGIGQALDDAGLPAPPIAHADFSRDGGARAARALWAAHPEVSAVVALNDVMAIGVLTTLHALGVAIPDDVAVAGVDDIPVASDMRPALTTFRLPMVTMGEIALDLALRDPAGRPRRRRVGGELVVRGSTAPDP